MQYHYTSWPDHGVPAHPLPVLSFIRKSSTLGLGPMLEAGEEEKEGGSGAQSQISESKQLFVAFINESNNIF